MRVFQNKSSGVKVTLKQAVIGLATFLLLFYCYTRMSFGEKIPFKISFVSCIGAVLLMFMFNLRRKLVISIWDLIAMIMLAIMYLWNNWDFQNGVTMSLFAHTILICFFMTASKNEQWVNFAFKFTIFMGMFYAFWTIVSWLSPVIYYNFVLPIVENRSIYNLSRQYQQGYMPGFTSHYSTNGLYLSMGICFALGYYFFDGRELKQVSTKGWIVLIVQLFALLLTGKRGPILYLIIAFFVTYIVYNVNKPVERYARILVLAFIGLIAFLIASAFIPQLANFIIRFREQMATGDVSSRRFDLWNDAMKQFFRTPFFGGGWFWYKYNNTFGSVNYHAHNCYIQWLCEVGIIGSIPFFAFTIVMYKRAMKIVRLVRLKRINLEKRELMFFSVPLIYQTFFVCMSFAGTAFYEVQSFCPYIICCSFTLLIWNKYILKSR